jgi:ACS family hexuronate transporter-like MFS transporter
MEPMTDGPRTGPTTGFRGMGYRWRMLALVFAATTINYMDRTVLSVLAPILQYKVFHWTDANYAMVTSAFQAAYAIGLVTMGAVLDRLGTRRGYTVSIAIWSLFDFLHAAVRPALSAVAFPLVRFGFGFGQAGTYPAGVKSVAEWFPRKERALATGIFNAGSNMGAILAPLFVAQVVSTSDGARWQWAFVATGTMSALCACLWWRWYRPPAEVPGLSAAERAYIDSDAAVPEPAPGRFRWRDILAVPETWAFAAAKTTDVAWWFYTFWIGKFLYDQFGLGVHALALPITVIFVAADAGSVGGGWLSSHLLRRGWSLNAARKATLLLCAALALPVGLATHLGGRFRLDVGSLAARDPGTLAQLPQAQLHALASADYGSAREYLAGADAALGVSPRQQFEAALIGAARPDRRYWLAVALIAVAAAAHQAWSATIFTFVSDVFPKRAVASVVGVGGMAGSVAGILAGLLLGHALGTRGELAYSLMFMAAGSSYAAALAVIQWLSPKMSPVVFATAAP